MSIHENDFRPVGPGYTISIEYEDREIEIQHLIGWTWQNGDWRPTYYDRGLKAIDLSRLTGVKELVIAPA